MARTQTAGKRSAKSPPPRVIGRTGLPKGVSLVAFEAGPLPAVKDGEDLPERLLILPWGRHETNKGVIICEANTAAIFNQQQAKWRRKRGVLDFQHNTLKGSPAYRGEPAKIAARGTFELVEGEGVYLSGLEWTPEGEAAYRGGHYEALSPAVVRDDACNVILCDSAAMCRQGEIDGLMLFAAEADITKLIAALAADDPIQTEEAMYKNLIVTLINAINKYFKAGATALSADSTEEDVSGAVEACVQKMEQGGAKPAKGDAPEGLAADVVTRAVKAATEPLIKRLDAFESRAQSSERDALVEQASRECKVIPLSAESIAKTDVATLREIIENLPAGEVPTDRATPGKVVALASSATQSREAEQIRQKCGTNPESMKKWGKDLPARLVGSAAALLLGIGMALSPMGARAADATSDILVPQMIGQDLALGVATNTTLYEGTIVALSNGYAISASDANLQTVVGRCEKQVTNTGDNGAAIARVRRGVFLWANSTADPVDQDDLGKFCYVEDNQTVAENPDAGTNRAGVIVKVLGASDSPTNGVWVDTTRVFHPALSIESGSVGSAGILDRGIASADIATNAITVVELADNSVDAGSITNAAVTLAKLASGISPSMVPKYWTNITVAAAASTGLAITVTGAAATDAVLATFKANPDALSLISAIASENTVTLETSLPMTNASVAVGVFRAAQ
ncbi:MAG TPA: phage protease [Verrucomicrobiae bacterium]|nr:phage protease [Verrucomicrobiae bacterium]